MRNYIFPIKKITSKFSKIKTIEDLQSFIQERSAHVTQTTLYGYIKTRIGTRFPLMLEDEKFSNSMNIAKWNIYISALSDCTFYTFSYLIDQKKLKQNDAKKTYFSILDNEIQNGLDKQLSENAKLEFTNKIQSLNWNRYHQEKPFSNSSLALYKWSPIADELKVLDKEIVLNSIKLKWNLVEEEFKDYTKNLNFN